MTILKQSQYMAIPSGEAKAFTIKSGAAEIYACSPEAYAYEGSEDYHKLFLTRLDEGESFFSPVEMLSPLEFQVFALTDCRIDEARAASLPGRELAAGALLWFRKLTSLDWIRYLIGLGDETLMKWESETVFETERGGAPDAPNAVNAPDAVDGENAAAILSDNLEILSMLIDARFKKAEHSVGVKTEARARHRGKVLSAAMKNLLSTEYAWMNAGESGASQMTDDPIQFAVCAAAKFMGMDIENISLPADIAAKMDPVTRMRRFIKKANMQVRLVSLPEEWYKNDGGAFLGYYGEEKELVALLPAGGRRYVMTGGKYQSGVPVNKEVASKIRSDAFMCYAGLSPSKLRMADIFKFMFRHTTKHDWTVIWLMSLVAGVLPVLMPLITESIFRDVIPINDRQALGTVTQVMLVSGFTAAIVGLVRSIALLRVKSHAGIAFESALWSRLLSLPTRFFTEYEAGDLVGRMQGVSRITELLGDNVLSSVFNMVFSFWSLVLMFYYNVKLTLISMAVWAVYLAANAFLYKGTMTAQRKETEAANEASAKALQILNGLTKFRLQGGESSAFYLWSQTFGEQWKWSLKSRWYMNYMSLINVIMPAVMSMVIFYITMGIITGGSAAGQAMDAVTFMGFQTAFSGFNATLITFVPVVSSLFSTLPFIENIMPILETEPEVTDDKIDVGELSGDIEVDNLQFSYAPDSPMILKGISLHIKAGESVAIVGPSGCGKSTFVRILLGFEKPRQGIVFFDGQDSSTLNVTSVRSQMGVVLQNGRIMSGDIFSNIVGSAPLTLEDAWEAARMVGLENDIKNMPMGMNTVISEGAGNLSGGQRQRILLARSIVNKPKIVILDEATSALDNVTQAIVTESMKKMKATRIVVAHRLSTIRDADRIFVFQGGLVAEEGSYEELMKADGLFAKLAKRQLPGA